MFGKNYESLLIDITSESKRKEYKKFRNQCKEIYLDLFGDDKHRIDKMKKEKERLRVNLESLKLPFLGMTISLVTAFFIFILKSLFDISVIVFNEHIAFFIALIYSTVIILGYGKIIVESGRRISVYEICLDVLNEIEDEIEQHGESNLNKNTLLEIAATMELDEVDDIKRILDNTEEIKRCLEKK